jgi:hypothetical protein
MQTGVFVLLVPPWDENPSPVMHVALRKKALGPLSTKQALGY